MFESDDPTISINASSSRTRIERVKTAPENLATGKIRRSAFIVVSIILVGCVGWGAWTFFGSSSMNDDDESFADLEGFESARPFVEASSNRSSSDSNLGDPSPLDSPALALCPPDPNDTIPSISESTNPLVSKVLVNPSKVWLTGTIEDTEPTEMIELPQRLSGGPNETSILR